MRYLFLEMPRCTEEVWPYSKNAEILWELFVQVLNRKHENSILPMAKYYCIVTNQIRYWDLFWLAGIWIYFHNISNSCILPIILYTIVLYRFWLCYWFCFCVLDFMIKGCWILDFVLFWRIDMRWVMLKIPEVTFIVFSLKAK